MGWGLVPSISPYKQDFGKVFSEKPVLKDNLKLKHLYKVGYFYYTKKNKLEYKVMSAGLSWEECFQRLDSEAS